MEELKNFNKTSLNKVESVNGFFKKDCLNLFNPYNRESRFEYCRSVDDSFPSMSVVHSYHDILSRANFNSLSKFTESINMYHSMDPSLLFDSLKQSRVFCNCISKHPDYDKLVNAISKNLADCTETDLNSLINLATNYENLSLVIFEPYLINMLGLTLFLGIMYPLHSKGAFKILLLDSVNKQIFLRHSLKRQLMILTTKSLTYIKIVEPLFMKFSYFISLPTVGAGIFTTAFGLSSKYFFHKSNVIPVDEKSGGNSVTTFSDLIDKELSKGKGLESIHVDKAIEFFSRLFFDLGRLWSSPTTSFMRGAISTVDDSVRAIGVMVDDELSKNGAVNKKDCNNNLK
jgi:hypothetical protein